MVYYGPSISTLNFYNNFIRGFDIDLRGKRGSGLQGVAAVCRQKVTVRALTPIDRIAPMGTGGTPMNGNASEVSIGDAAFPSETICRLSVFFFAVAG